MNLSLNKKRIIILLLILLGGVLVGGTAGILIGLTHDLPQIRSLESFKPKAVTRIYSADRVLLTELFIENRDPVPLKQIPSYLTAAIVATEDRKFYKHSGVDLKGIARALYKDIKAGDFVEGASTITQQLSKTLFLTPRKTLTRKLKEAILAFQLERRYTKDEILELYLNQVYFGSGAYGVEAAAQIFFGKSVKDLSLAECALVAGMPKSPSRYSPMVNKDLAIKRRNIVLKQMHATGIISETQYRQAVQEELQSTGRKEMSVKAPYFIAYVKKFLEEKLSAGQLYKSGLSVFTTLNYELQQAAEGAVANGLSELEKRMQSRNQINPAPQAALFSLDIRTGGIVAMVGGSDYSESAFNRATMAKRQPGSAFKPIVYALAVENGFPQNKMLLDAPLIFKKSRDGDDWHPHNFSGSFEGEMTMRRALAISQNIPAVGLIEMLGPGSVVQFAHNLGIQSNLAPNLSLSLGSSEVTLVELVTAYAVFANRGQKIEPFGVLEVVDDQNRVVWRPKPQKRLVMSRAGAAVITNMLEAVVNEGTGRRAENLPGPIAGKTGTTNDYRDALFIGFSPSNATGVWVGQDWGGSLGHKETGARAALPIWMEFMQAVLADGPQQYFDMPDDIIQIYIDPYTGIPRPAGSPDAVPAFFKKGTEPKAYK